MRNTAQSRTDLRQARTVTVAVERARARAEALHKRRGDDWMVQRYNRLLTALGVTWNTPRTPAVFDLLHDVLNVARKSVAAKQEGRVTRIDRAEALMRAGDYVRPSRLNGWKLGLGE